MAVNSSATDSEFPKPVNVVFQTDLLDVAKSVAPYFDGTMGTNLNVHRGTNSVKWRRVEKLTAVSAALTELTSVAGYDRTPDNPSVTDYEAAVLKYGNYILLTEEADLFNYNGQDAKIVEILGINAGESLDKLQRNEMEDNSGITYVGGVASDGVVASKITLTAVETVINSLVRNDTMPFRPGTMGSQNLGTLPTLESFNLICHPDVAYDIAKFATGFTSVEKYAGQRATSPGEFGTIAIAGYAVRCLQTNHASIDANSGAGTAASLGLRGSTGSDLYTTVIYGANAVGSVGFGFEHIKEIYRDGDMMPSIQLIMKERGSSGTADPYNELSTMAWKSWHAAKVLNTNWIQGIRSGATALSG